MAKKHTKLYRVTQVYDKVTKKPSWKPRMYGQSAFAYVLSDQAAEALGSGDVWALQEQIAPMVGRPLYFESTKPDAGWYRSSSIIAFEYSWNKKRLSIETAGSILLVEEEE